jgi:very-short-patch-repair endonuclease
MPRFTRRPEAIARARRLRRNATDVEWKLWAELKAARFEGAPFRRQHPVGPYILDFYCAPLKLAIELDGGQHAARVGYDAARTRFLAGRGIRVIRFWNNDVMENPLGVLERLRQEILVCRREMTPTRRAARVDLPLSGGGDSLDTPR